MGIEHIHGGDVFGAAKDLGFEHSEILDFSANINPLGPPPGVFEAIQNNINMIIHYPDPHCRDLKNFLSEYLGIDEEYIVLGNGVAELIYLLVRILESKRAIIPVPTFTEYAISMITAGGSVIEIPLRTNNNFDLNEHEIISKISKGDIIFVCNPNNPTGNLFSPEKLISILKAADSAGAYFVIDEAFMDFVDNYKNHSLIKQVKNYNNLYVLYSLTKFFGIPGLRLGCMVGNPSLIKKMNSAKDPWNVNLFAQVGGAAALKDTDHMVKTKKLINSERKYLYNKLTALPGLHPYSAQANFLFVDVKGTGYTSKEFKSLLSTRGILVRDCSSFSGLDDDYIRLAVKDQKSNKRLIIELSTILEGAN
ncbi:MAG: threonine-phosphate decarboxylase CobD [Clostridiales bacterium]|nr:threonine-phosphate decarboxylase CobD [Clostridiales bacterium]MCF8023395.1 threonine-phosphate decarboxylase CobD [Clostridiales bacterium]